MEDTRKNVITIPNLFSFARILLIPVIILLYRAEKFSMAVIMILVSSATDVIDGFIARKFNMVSDLGKVLDPIADKLTQGMVMICLSSRYPFMLWLIILFTVKELIMLFMGYLTMKYAHSVNSAEWYGKACTVLIFSSMAALILFPGIGLSWVKRIVILDAAAVVASLLLYMRFYIRIWKKAVEEYDTPPVFLRIFSGRKQVVKASDLSIRVRTGFILTIVITFFIIFSYHAKVLNLFCALISVMAAFELYRSLGAGLRPTLLMIAFSLFGVAVSFVDIPNYIALLGICYPLFVPAGVGFLANLDRIKGKKIPVRLTIALMAPLFFRAMPELRELDNGLFLLILTIGVPVLTDIFAYLIGRKIGKRKIAPGISPNKTLAGSVGGTLVSTALMFIVSACFLRPLDLGSAVLLLTYLVTASILGQLGDLLLSGTKRFIGIKDFGRILPGHGGILDRFDSLMLVAPYTLLYAVLVL